MKIILYKDKKGEYRWKMVSRNGRIIANSAGDGYKRKGTMMKTVNLVMSDWYEGGYDLVDKTGK